MSKPFCLLNSYAPSLLVVDDNIDLYTRLDLNRSNLLHNLRRSMQINQPLVNPHLKGIPSIGTLSTGGLTGGNSKLLGGHTNGSRNLELLGDSRTLEVGTYLLNVLYIARGEGDAYTVDYGGSSLLSGDFFFGCVSRYGL